MIKSLGGKTEMLKLFRLIYFADINHLSKFGLLITCDRYIAMKNGAVPFYVFLLHQKLLTNNQRIEFENNLNEYFLLEDTMISNLQEYDASFLSRSEVECIFETVRAYKQSATEVIINDSMNAAWSQADAFNEISIEALACSGMATDDMLAYIRYSHKMTPQIAVPDTLSVSKSKSELSLFTINVGSVLVNNANNNMHLYIVIGMSLSHFAFIEIIPAQQFSIADFYEKLQVSFLMLSEAYDFISPDAYVDCSRLITMRYGDLNTQLKQNVKTVAGKISQKDVYILLGAIHDNYTISSRIKEEFLFIIEQ